MKPETKHKYFIEGAISAAWTADMVQKHQSKTDVGAHSLFMGQVRADAHDGATVSGIEYSAYVEMAEKEIAIIREEAFEKFTLRCLHIHHSLGYVPVGEISLVIMVSSAHRGPVFTALEFLVEEVKKRVPIWKKEMLSDGTHRWVDGNPPKSV